MSQIESKKYHTKRGGGGSKLNHGLQLLKIIQFLLLRFSNYGYGWFCKIYIKIKLVWT